MYIEVLVFGLAVKATGPGTSSGYACLFWIVIIFKDQMDVVSKVGNGMNY